MKQNQLDELMKKRNPLPARDSVVPADFYHSPQVDKTTNPQVDLPANGQPDLSTNPQNDKSAVINDPELGAIEIKTESPQVHKPTSGQNHKRLKPQVDKSAKPRLEKYTTHLEPAAIKAIKRYALENDLNDYQVAQSAFEKFLKDKQAI